jgi:OPA family glycerol-3-phosphate transporter-like MFS transporter 1/2
MSEKTPLNTAYKDPSALVDLARLKNYQKYVFFVTFGSYFMSHFARKCVSEEECRRWVPRWRMLEQHK